MPEDCHYVYFFIGIYFKDFYITLLTSTTHSPRSSIQKPVHFLPFMKRFGNFSFYSEATESQFFFSVKFRDLLFSFGNFPIFEILVWYISEVVYSKSDYFVLV